MEPRWAWGLMAVACAAVATSVGHPVPALADTKILPPAFVGTWASRRAHCGLDGVYTLQPSGWIEGETWICELARIDRSGGRLKMRGACVSEQTSERAERTLEVRTEGSRLTHIDGLRVLRCR